MRLVRDYLGRISLLPLLVHPAARLDAAYDAYGACLAEMSRDEFSCLPPCGHIDEVRLRLLSILCAVAAVDSDREGSDRNAGRRGFQFRICCDPTGNDRFVQIQICHCSPHPSASAAVKDACTRVSTSIIFLRRSRFSASCAICNSCANCA